MADSQNEARLKAYWGWGQGSFLIRWGTPGDFTRCDRELSRHIPSERMRKGFCANLHHDVLGYWPGDRGKPGNPPDVSDNG